MTQLASTISNVSTPAPLSDVYRPIASELEATTDLLKERLRHSDSKFDEYLEYSFRLGGKRLRPALVLLCGLATGKVERRHHLVAAALEMIHTGSLVHDDILDGARFRRKLETINAKWDSKRAVLIGDLLIARALELVCECDDSYVFQKMTSSCKTTVEGELFQTEAIGNFELTNDDYYKIVGGKTAALLSAATSLGAYLGGARDEELSEYERFGRCLGIAFQIVDDVLDLVGDEQNVGKTLGTDLENKKETLPLILYFQKATSEERDSLRKRLDVGVDAMERDEIARMLQTSGAIDAARKEADALIDEALLIVGRLRDAARADGRDASVKALDSLEMLARFVVKRDK